MVIDFPRTSLLERSQAHVTAKPSFYVCAFLHSMLVMDRDMNDTGHLELPLATRPHQDQMKMYQRQSLFPYKVNTGAVVRAIFV